MVDNPPISRVPPLREPYKRVTTSFSFVLLTWPNLQEGRIKSCWVQKAMNLRFPHVLIDTQHVDSQGATELVSDLCALERAPGPSEQGLG